MAAIRMLIEVYGGIVQSLYIAHETPESQVEAVIVDWDYECYDGADDCVVHATGLDGSPTLACVSKGQAKPWRLLPSTGILDVLDRAGLADFGSLNGAAPPLGETAGARRSVRGEP